MANTATYPDWYPYTYDRQIRSELQQMESRIKSVYGMFYNVPEAGLRFQIGGASTSQQRQRGWNQTNPAEALHRQRWLHMHDGDSNNARDYRVNDEWIDELDAQRLGEVGDPTPERIRSQVAKAERDCDNAIITGLGENAYEGTTSPGAGTAFDTNYTIAKDFSGSSTGMTFRKVNRLTAVLGAANVTGMRVENQSSKCIVCTHFEIEDLLQQTEFTSMDYSTRKRAEAGEVFDYQDITFVPVSPELLPIDATGGAGTYFRVCYGFAKSAIAIGRGTNRIHRVTQEGTQNSAILLHLVDGYTCARIHDQGVYKIESYRTDNQYADEVVFETLP